MGMITDPREWNEKIDARYEYKIQPRDGDLVKESNRNLTTQARNKWNKRSTGECLHSSLGQEKEKHLKLKTALKYSSQISRGVGGGNESNHNL